MRKNIRSNFDMLEPYEPQLWRLGALAERYFAEDPNTSLLKLRQFGELLAQSVAARGGLGRRQATDRIGLRRSRCKRRRRVMTGETRTRSRAGR